MALKFFSLCSPLLCKKNIFIACLAFELPCSCKGGALKGEHNQVQLGQMAKILSDRIKCNKQWKAGLIVTKSSLSYLVTVAKVEQYLAHECLV